ncbi:MULTISPECIES: DUF1203 domain-containing protein [unclassified Streptomyces]|uniref:DUF1203 domain-containing protein n=1 Tax=unclassified Streptomyces TaxID=2593676 RepID=UPI003811BFED
MTTAYTVHPTYSSPFFSVRAIDPAVLERLRRTDDAGLTPEPAVDGEGGAPLRCCLRRSAPGERVALVAYAPLRRWAAATGARPGPYDETGPVFVHARAADCPGPPAGTGHAQALGLHGEHRVLRSYDGNGRILGGRLVLLSAEEAAAGAAEAVLATRFADPRVALVHVRAVEYGCFLYEAVRAR